MNIHSLTPVEYRIVEEICCFLARHGDGSPAVQDAISILGQWGETLPEEQVLKQLEELNDKGSMWDELRARHPGLEVRVEGGTVWLRFRSPDGAEAYVSAGEISERMGRLGRQAVLQWAETLKERSQDRPDR